MRLRFPPIAACLLAVLLLARPAWSAPPPASLAAQQIEALVEGGAPLLPPSATEARVKRFYEARHFEPAWGDEARVAALAAVLAGASEHGLDLAFPKAAWPTGGDPAARDVALTRLALAYAAALGTGRVNFTQIEADWALP